MTLMTTAPAEAWEVELTERQPLPRIIHTEPDADHVDRIARGEDALNPDPTARRRMASLLQSATGWDIFPELEPDRAYVSRLWAEDWDSPEDSAHDE